MDKIIHHYTNTNSGKNFHLSFQTPININIPLKNEIENKREDSKIISYEDFLQGLERQEEAAKKKDSIDSCDSDIKLVVNQFQNIMEEEKNPQNTEYTEPSLEFKIDNIKKNLFQIDLSKLKEGTKYGNNIKSGINLKAHKKTEIDNTKYNPLKMNSLFNNSKKVTSCCKEPLFSSNNINRFVKGNNNSKILRTSRKQDYMLLNKDNNINKYFTPKEKFNKIEIFKVELPKRNNKEIKYINNLSDFSKESTTSGKLNKFKNSILYSSNLDTSRKNSFMKTPIQLKINERSRKIGKSVKIAQELCNIKVNNSCKRGIITTFLENNKVNQNYDPKKFNKKWEKAIDKKYLNLKDKAKWEKN